MERNGRHDEGESALRHRLVEPVGRHDLGDAEALGAVPQELRRHAERHERVEIASLGCSGCLDELGTEVDHSLVAERVGAGIGGAVIARCLRQAVR